MPLLDYAGKISIVADEDHDTNKSSFILFKDEEAGVFVDIDAASCGNEGRFVNDYHGTGVVKPNAQFWPYFDPITGEKRMAIKCVPSAWQPSSCPPHTIPPTRALAQPARPLPFSL